MRITSLRTIFGLLMLGGGLFGLNTAHAFCIYNSTSSPVYAQQLNVTQQLAFRGMSKIIPAASNPTENRRGLGLNLPKELNDPNPRTSPGSECCHWSNGECNPSKRQDSVVAAMLRVQVKQGTNLLVGRTGGEGYFCGQQDAQDNWAVPFAAGGFVTVEPYAKHDARKEISARNPKFVAKVFAVNGQHVKTYPCPGATRNSSWRDLEPDWSDVATVLLGG